MSSRLLTISGLYTSPSSRKPVPAVRVQGKWLQELGFSIGDRVEIYGDREAITIRLAKEQRKERSL
jgi:HSP20-like domain of unknown function (DUF1813).